MGLKAINSWTRVERRQGRGIAIRTAGSAHFVWLRESLHVTTQKNRSVQWFMQTAVSINIIKSGVGSILNLSFVVKPSPAAIRGKSKILPLQLRSASIKYGHVRCLDLEQRLLIPIYPPGPRPDPTWTPPPRSLRWEVPFDFWLSVRSEGFGWVKRKDRKDRKQGKWEGRK